jgi:hypothetical protein
VVRPEEGRVVSKGDWMLDLLMIVFTCIFFVVAIAYTVACDRLK